MRKFITILIFAISIAFLSGCNNNSEFHPKGVKHVVIIGVDGMSVPGLMEAETPNFDSYIKNGAYTFHARDIFPTVSAPNWTAMLTGSSASQTGVTTNNWKSNNYNLPPVITTENGRYPDIFYAIKKSNPQLKTAAVYDWGHFGYLFDKTNVDIDYDTKGERITAKKAAEVLRNDKPNFLFIQIDNVDHALHAHGHMSHEYIKAIELADSLAKIIVDASKEAGIFEKTLFVIVPDHGGKGFGHGHESISGNEIPFILYGEKIKKGYEIPVVVNMYDVAGISAYALNVTQPQAWLARPVKCAFEGAPEPDPATIAGKFLAPATYVPEIYPRKMNGESGGLFIDKKAMVTIKSRGNNGEIRYTTDGTIPTKQSAVYTEAFEMQSSGVVRAVYFGKDGGQSAFAEGYFRVVKKATENTGISYKIYKGKNWAKLPDFSTLKPVSFGKTYEISVDGLEDKINDDTAIAYDGFIHVKKEGLYYFSTRSDDGSKMYIDGNLIVNNDGDHGVQEREGSIELKAGKHKIRVEFFNGYGGYLLNATFSGPGVPKQIISPEFLTIR